MSESKKEVKEAVVLTDEEPKKLYRSEKDRMLAGVAGGLGEYFHIDTALVRLLFIISVLAGGSGILVYLVLWAILPTESSVKKESSETVKENTEEIKNKAETMATGLQNTIKKDDSKMWWGIILTVVGLLFLFDNFGIFKTFHITVWQLWPIALVVFGLIILGRKE